MGLRPLQDALGQAGLTAHQLATPFRSSVESELAAFQAVRANLERQVRTGDLTIKAARERAAVASHQMRTRLFEAAEHFSPVSRLFLDRLVDTAEVRQRARSTQSLESLQRENNRLLRSMLIEQQLVNRAAEFESQAFTRPIHGGSPGPTLAGLLKVHQTSTQAGDEAALEWTRRQLEAFRARTIDANDQRRIDEATQRPDRVNAQVVGRYVEALRAQTNEQLEAFVRVALESADANACTAAFVVAREANDGTALRWVRELLDGLNRFPDTALETLRAWETEARQNDAAAARASATFAVAIAEAEARFPDLQPPTDADIAKRQRILARPAAADGETIGLNLARRGRMAEDQLVAGQDPTLAAVDYQQESSS